MPSRYRTLSLLLWFCVIAWSTWMGGTLYQMLVIVPIWSSAPPESVRAFFEGTSYNETIFNFFGPPFMLIRVLPVIVALFLAWRLPRHRALLGTAALCLLAAIVFTLIFVYPINDELFFAAGAGKSAEQVQQMVDTWIWADRLRFVVGTVAFLLILRAFQTPLQSGGNA